MRVGVLGCGYISQARHLPAIRNIEGIELAALCDLSPGTLELVADHHGVERRYTSYEDMLADDSLDAIGVLSYDHAGDILAALRADKHVLTEKPLAFTVEEAEDILAVLAAKPHLVLTVGYQKLHDPAVLWLADKVASEAQPPRSVGIHDYAAVLDRVRGNFGPIFRVDDIPEIEGAVVRTTVGQKGSGAKLHPLVVQRVAASLDQGQEEWVEAYMSALMLGSHDFGVLNLCFGTPKRVLYAHSAHPNRLQSMLELENGTPCYVDLQLGNQYGWWDERFSVYSEDDQVDLRFGNPFLAFSETQIITRSTQGENDRTFATAFRGYEDGFWNEWSHFRDCVAGVAEVRATAELATNDIRLVRSIANKLGGQ